MPLEILVPMVVIGIALAWLLVRALVNAPARLITSPQVAADRYRLDFPMDEVSQEWVIADNESTAFAAVTNCKAVAMVMCVGSKQLTRKLASGDIASVTSGDGLVKVALNDFTLPGVDVALSNQRRQDALVDLLKSVVEHFNGEEIEKERVPLS